MANAIPFTLITPLAVKFDGEAELVIAVGTEGEEGILPSHAPFLTALKPGVLRANVREAGGETRRLELATGEGFLQALPGKVTVLTDAALAQNEIDIAQTRADLAAALEAQKAGGSDMTVYAREQSKIDFANAKLKVAGVS
ncbi:MAG: F0F1 ATP synthase subunit epsilon [Candidatus Velthaea sp.]